MLRGDFINNYVFICRGLKSLIRETAVHNFLYNLGIVRERTGSVDLNFPQKWWAEVGYFLLGWCRIFIK